MSVCVPRASPEAAPSAWTRRKSAACAPFAIFSGSGILNATTAPDPLVEAVARWQEKIRSSEAVEEGTKQIRESAAPRIGDAERALASGQRWVALSRMALVWTDLEAAEYSDAIATDLRQQMSNLEREWGRLGPQLATGNLEPAPAGEFRLGHETRRIGRNWPQPGQYSNSLTGS